MGFSIHGFCYLVFHCPGRTVNCIRPSQYCKTVFLRPSRTVKLVLSPKPWPKLSSQNLTKNLDKNLIKNYQNFPPCLRGASLRTSSAKIHWIPPLKKKEKRENKYCGFCSKSLLIHGTINAVTYFFTGSAKQILYPQNLSFLPDLRTDPFWENSSIFFCLPY